MKRILVFVVLSLWLLSLLPAQNVLISNKNYPSEPSIRINPSNPAVIVAGSVLNNVYYSQDTGRTWNEKTLTSTHGVWGDPVIDVDTAGNLYYFHLSNPPSGNWIDRIVCQKSTDNGLTWSDGTYTGLNGTRAQDKQWSVIDRNTNAIYLTWTQFDKYGSAAPADSSVILFSKSEDGGDTWSTPLRINKVAGDCIDSDNTVEGAVPAVGPNGEVYVAWAGPAGIRFDRSTDGGQTWLVNDILVDPMPGGWDYDIPGIDRCNGLPVTKCDLSNGVHHGTIYINWSDQRNGTHDTDVWLSRSADGGDTWSQPVRVNDDTPGRHQFLTWMDIDPTSGYLYFVFYDRRNHADNHTDVYLAVSMDGGLTFLNRKISESAFKPVNGIFFGDYNNINVHNGIVRPIWTRLHNGQLSIWTDITPLETLLTATPSVTANQGVMEWEQFPNPASGMAHVSFKLHGPSSVSLSIHDLQGRHLFTLLDGQVLGYGKHVLPVDPIKAGLKSGNYLCVIQMEGRTQVRKFVVAE